MAPALSLLPSWGSIYSRGRITIPPPLKNVTVLRRLSYANSQLLVRSLTLTPVPPRSPQMQRREIRYTGELTKVGGSLTHEPPGRGSWGGTSGRLPVWAPIISQALSIQIPQKGDTASPADILAKHAPPHCIYSFQDRSLNTQRSIHLTG